MEEKLKECINILKNGYAQVIQNKLYIHGVSTDRELEKEIPFLDTNLYNYAIENILNRLEQDERVIEEMGKWINDLGCINLDIDKDIIDHFRKKCE